MTLAPLVGAALACVAGALLWLLDELTAPPTLAAALVVALLAALTRAMHLDGLADTADGLGSAKPASAALEVMRRGDVGPFGVVTLVLALLLQVLSLGSLVPTGEGGAGLLVALVVSRTMLPIVCARGIPAARAGGLGHAVAGAVTPLQLGLAGASCIALLVVPALTGHLTVLALAAATLLALAAGGLLTARAVRRLGGVTGDVLGAAVEVAFTAGLVTLALAG
jgi:adenosylcobinamide-GDP ribazoletransferase